MKRSVFLKILFQTINYRVKTLFRFSIKITGTRKEVQRPSGFLKRSQDFTGSCGGENSFSRIYILADKMCGNTRLTKYRRVRVFRRKKNLPVTQSARVMKRKHFCNFTPSHRPSRDSVFRQRSARFSFTAYGITHFRFLTL